MMAFEIDITHNSYRRVSLVPQEFNFMP